MSLRSYLYVKRRRVATSPPSAAEWSTNTGTSTAIPLELVEGSDGRIWFYRNGEARISALNVGTGVITDYTRSAGSESIGGICSGPDGNIWYTVYNTAKVGKLTTSGTFTEYDVGVAGEQICSNGTYLYYCSYSAGTITRVTTSGSSVQYGTIGSLLLTGACASGGFIWSCAYVGDKIVKMTDGGSMTYYTVSSGGNPWLCSPDGDGIVFSTYIAGGGEKIWFCTSDGTISSKNVTGGDIQKPILFGGNYYWGRRADQKIGKLSGTTYSDLVSSTGSTARYVLGLGSYLYYQTNNKIARVVL